MMAPITGIANFAVSAQTLVALSPAAFPGRLAQPGRTQLAFDKTSNQSTQAAFRIIEEMAEVGDPIALSDLARRLSMPKPRVFRFLKTLRSLGYVAQNPATERYRLTLKIFSLGQSVADRTTLLAEARPILAKLRNAVQQTIVLSSIEAQGIRIVDLVRVDTPVQIVMKPGSLLDFHSTAQGKLALAFGPQELWDTIKKSRMKKYTSRTITDLPKLQKEIALVRKRQWAEAPGEVIEGISAVAAPIFNSNGQLEATVSVVGLIGNVTSPPNAKIISAVRHAARSISASLGNVESTK